MRLCRQLCTHASMPDPLELLEPELLELALQFATWTQAVSHASAARPVPPQPWLPKPDNDRARTAPVRMVLETPIHFLICFKTEPPLGPQDHGSSLPQYMPRDHPPFATIEPKSLAGVIGVTGSPTFFGCNSVKASGASTTYQ